MTKKPKTVEVPLDVLKDLVWGASSFQRQSESAAHKVQPLIEEAEKVVLADLPAGTVITAHLLYGVDAYYVFVLMPTRKLPVRTLDGTGNFGYAELDQSTVKVLFNPEDIDDSEPTYHCRTPKRCSNPAPHRRHLWSPTTNESTSAVVEFACSGSSVNA